MLGMPMWSVTEERAAALEEEMRRKKQAREDLEAKHPHTLWIEDLDALEHVLSAHEAQEEADRAAQGKVNAGGKRGRKGAKRAPAKAVKGSDQKAIGQGGAGPKKATGAAATGQAKLDFGSKKAAAKPKQPEQLSLKERMAARYGGDIPMAQAASMHKGSDGLTAAQREAVARGPGHKRAPEETTIFKELQQLASMAADDSDLDESEPKGSMAQRKPQIGSNPMDLSKRREYAALQEVQPNASSRPAQKAPANARRRRAVVDSDEESSSGWSEEEDDEEDAYSVESEVDESEFV